MVEEGVRRGLERAYVRGVAQPEDEHLLGRTLGELAEERGSNPVEVVSRCSPR